MIPLEIGPGIEVVPFGDQGFPDVLLPIDDNALDAAQLKIDHVTILPAQSTERLVWYLVATHQVEVTDDGPSLGHRRFQ